MKSGTTYLCNMIGFYRASQAHRDDISFDNLPIVGVFRDRAQLLDELMQFAEKQFSYILQTHKYVKSTPAKCILLSRDPFDYALSSYCFHFKHRNVSKDIEFLSALPVIVNTYVQTRQWQASILRQKSTPSLAISYDEIIRDPEKTLKLALEFFDSEIIEPYIIEAVEKASTQKLIDYEKVTKRAIVADSSFTEGHFIRSGRSGEFYEVLSDEEIVEMRSQFAARNCYSTYNDI